jgi:integration host factor subunit alpha
MKVNSTVNLTKKEIVFDLQKKTGLSNLFLKTVVEDLIETIKASVKENNLNIKNFGTFKLISKKERIGRNPKTKKLHKINSRKSVSFYASKFLKEKLNI